MMSSKKELDQPFKLNKTAQDHAMCASEQYHDESHEVQDVTIAGHGHVTSR